ncbi:hypothetical protein AB4865_02090 [Capnocytophaga sp. ARDL2]|uniref:hypothetical protein n=1 Tax=Capnocytophaga sp. ARDL2 TaxID=3238809 RepID=UPI003558E1ED
MIFNHLSPSEYHIKIRAKVHLDNLQEKELEFYIKITHPFTQSTTFYVFISLIVIEIIYLRYAILQ